MDDVINKSLKINIDNYSGPLEVLLDLAKTQKVDLANISITQLADQFIDFMNEAKEINLDLASEYLLMATWLAYLKSKLLLPQDDDDFKASEVAEKLKLQLKKLIPVHRVADYLRGDKKIIFREMALLKVVSTSTKISRAKKICSRYHPVILDKTSKSIVFQITALRSEIDKVVFSLGSLGLASVSRTGAVAMTKGSTVFK